MKLNSWKLIAPKPVHHTVLEKEISIFTEVGAEVGVEVSIDAFISRITYLFIQGTDKARQPATIYFCDGVRQKMALLPRYYRPVKGYTDETWRSHITDEYQALLSRCEEYRREIIALFNAEISEEVSEFRFSEPEVFKAEMLALCRARLALGILEAPYEEFSHDEGLDTFVNELFACINRHCGASFVSMIVPNEPGALHFIWHSKRIGGNTGLVRIMTDLSELEHRVQMYGDRVFEVIRRAEAA